jgi:hypothetical protein
MPVGELSFFRYATSATDPPTISLDEAPFAEFDSVSVGHYTWPADRVPEPGSDPGGGLFLPIGQGIQPDTPFVVVVVTLNGYLPTVSEPDSLFKNISIVFQDLNQPGWQHQGDFVADTWREGCCIL